MANRKSLRTGDALVKEVFGGNHQRSFDGILQNSYRLEAEQRRDISRSLRQAEVSVCRNGEYAIEGVEPKLITRRLKTVSDAYSLPSGQISFHSDLVSYTEQFVRTKQRLFARDGRSTDQAARAMYAFEIGRYVGYGIWHTLVERREAGIEADVFDGPGGFYNQLAEDLVARGVMESGQGADVAQMPALIDFYRGQIFCERFFSRAGVLMVEEVDPSIDAEQLMLHLRDENLNAFVGTGTEHGAGVVGGYESDPSGVELPTLKDRGALSPISEKAFRSCYLAADKLGLAAVHHIGTAQPM